MNTGVSSGSKPTRIASILNWSRLFFFVSGATSLVYQVLWIRRLSLTFGHTVLAVSTVVTAFMMGLALGSILAGRWTDTGFNQPKSPRFLAAYGYLEAFIGLWALATLPLLSLVESGYVALAANSVSGTTLHLACFFAAAVVLVPPTCAMGATLPVLTRLLTKKQDSIGEVLSQLYGWNTLGACLGAGLGGFFLLPGIGLTLSLCGAAITNLAIGFCAVMISRHGRWELPAELAEIPDRASSRSSSQANKKSVRKKKSSCPAKQRRLRNESDSNLDWVPIAFALAGLASMMYQVSWNRTICLGIGSSVYAFSTILVTFLIGLGLGSLLYGYLKSWVRPSLVSLGLLFLAVGFAGGTTIVSVEQLPLMFFKAFPFVKDSFPLLIATNSGMISLVLFVPTLLMGLAFPLATEIYSDSLEKLGSSVGTVYGANTVGCILGAFLTGFVVIPQMGAQVSMQLATAVYFLAALMLLLRKRELSSAKVGIFVGLLCTLLTFALPRWNTAVMASGLGVYSSVHKNVSVDTLQKSILVKPAVYLDGLSSVVSLHFSKEDADMPYMCVNGKVDASRGGGDRFTQYFLGYLPTLLHGNPKRVGIIGLGGGFTVEAVANCQGVEQIDVAELEPAVLQIGEYWKPYNDRVLEDSRVRVHIKDGRTFVLGSPEKFDVLISEPSNPWLAGIGNLFTKDFYEISRSRLTDDGIMCQWFNIYAVSTDDMRMVIRSFYEVFPEGQVWQSSGGDIILLGSVSEISRDYDAFRRAWEGSEDIRRHLYETRVFFPDALLGHFLITREQALEMAQGAKVNSDDLPLLEFSAPLSLYRNDVQGLNRALLYEIADTQFAPGLNPKGDQLRHILFGFANINRIERLEEELSVLGDSHPLDYVLRSIVTDKTVGKVDQVKNILEDGREIYPDNPMIALILGEIALALGEYDKSSQLLQEAFDHKIPGSEVELRMKLAKALDGVGQTDEAIRILAEAAEVDPVLSFSVTLAGEMLVSKQRDREALELFSDSLKRNPHDPKAHLGLAHSYFNLGLYANAERSLRRYLIYMSSEPSGWKKLGMCLKVMGKKKASLEAFKRALELKPDDADTKSQLELLKSGS